MFPNSYQIFPVLLWNSTNLLMDNLLLIWWQDSLNDPKQSQDVPICRIEIYQPKTIYSCIFILFCFCFSDAPTILVDDPWVHAGQTSTIMLKCRICATRPFAVREHYCIKSNLLVDVFQALHLNQYFNLHDCLFLFSCIHGGYKRMAHL